MLQQHFVIVATVAVAATAFAAAEAVVVVGKENINKCKFAIFMWQQFVPHSIEIEYVSRNREAAATVAEAVAESMTIILSGD